MLEKFKDLAARLEEIERSMQDPKVLADSAGYASLMKERARLGKWVTPYLELLKVRRDLADHESLLADPEMKELAAQEIPALKERETKLLAALEDLALSNDETTSRSVIMEIRPGVGGDEAALFAAELMRMYVKYASRRGWQVDMLENVASELGGMKYATFSIDGEDVYKFLRFESGTHRVQRVPSTEASGRIHTSTATVAVMPQAEDVDVEINLNDVRIDTYSAGGPGGQHVNKTQSAVRLTHAPTGIVVQCQDQRSQTRNKDLAFRWLRAKLYEHALEKAARERADLRRNQIGTGDRSEKIRTYNFPQNRITDHRLGSSESWHNIGEVMEGALEEIHERLLQEDRKEKLKALGARQ